MGLIPGVYFNDLHQFDASQQQWTPLAPQGDGASGLSLPSPRMGHSATLVGELVYVFGGYTTEYRGSRKHRVATNDLWALETSAQVGAGGKRGMRWLQVATVGQAPPARGFHAAVASPSGGNLFVTTGCNEVRPPPLPP